MGSSLQVARQQRALVRCVRRGAARRMRRVDLQHLDDGLVLQRLHLLDAADGFLDAPLQQSYT